MNFAEKSYGIFEQSVADYHIDDDVDAATRQPSRHLTRRTVTAALTP